MDIVVAYAMSKIARLCGGMTAKDFEARREVITMITYYVNRYNEGEMTIDETMEAIAHEQVGE